MKIIRSGMRAGMIAILCMACVLTAGVSWSCRIDYSLVGGTMGGGTLPTEEHSRTYLAAAEMIYYELQGSLISPAKEDILNTCTDGCCYFVFEPLFMRACLDGSFCWKQCFSEPCDYEYCDTWDVVCPCEDDSDCDDGVFCNGAEVCDNATCASSENPCDVIGLICDEEEAGCVECLDDSDCSDVYFCEDTVCRPRCELLIKYKEIRVDRLHKDRKVTLKITGGEDLNIFDQVDLGPLVWNKRSFNAKKNSLKIKAIVPAGLEPQIIPIRVGDCYGEIEVLGPEGE